MRKQQNTQDSIFHNPFFYLTTACLILAIVSPIITILFGGWETKLQTFIASTVLFILFTGAAGAFNWIARK